MQNQVWSYLLPGCCYAVAMALWMDAKVLPYVFNCYVVSRVLLNFTFFYIRGMYL